METTSTNGHGNGYASDEAIDLLYAWMPGTTPVPQPCPEAVLSLTLKGTLDGQEALLTARGQTVEEFRRNLEAIRGLLDPVEAQTEAPIKDWCPKHQTRMYLNDKNGRQWYSHKLPDGVFCKGK